MANDTNLPAPRPARTLMIKNLTPSLPERGKIKIGMKGQMMTSRGGAQFQPPQKLDHFLVTTMERGKDGNFVVDAAVHTQIGDKPTEIPIRLLYDDPTLNFPTRYAAYQGRTLWCSGDGERANRLRPDKKGYEALPCPCGRQDPSYQGPDKCKMNGNLQALIEGAGGIGGVWKLRTTSYNTIVGLLSSMGFIRSVTGGPLANIPLKLTLRAKQATAPDGKQQTIYVVGLEFEGNIAELQKQGHAIALERATTHVSIQHIEEEARRLLLGPPADVPLPGDDGDDIVEEFYPEQVNAENAPPRPTRESVAEAPAEPVKEAEPELPAYEIVDEVGELEVTCHTAEDFATNLIAAAAHPRRGPPYVKNNAETAQAVLADLDEGKLKQKLAALYPASPPELPPPADDQAAEAPPPEDASADPALEIGLVMRGNKPDWNGFIKEVNGALANITTLADLAAFDQANTATADKAAVGIKNTYRMAIKQCQAKITGRAA